MLWLTFVVC